MSDDTRRPLVYFGVVPYHSICQRPQQLAIELAPRLPIVYVEPTRSPLGAVRQRAWGVAPEGMPSGVANIDLYVPDAVLPFSGYLPFLNRANYAWLAGRLRLWLGERGYGSPLALFVSFPKHVSALASFPGVPVLYDVMDDYSQFYDRWQGAVLERMHRRLARRADRVVASSRTLVDRLAAIGARAALVSNGVSRTFVEACVSATPDPALAELPRPRLGYVGAVSEWFDFNAVHALASEIREGTVIVVGPVDAPIPSLPSNVRFVGARSYATLPAALAAFDAGLIPFRRSPKIDAVNPVKAYEYFAAGLPVLSSAFTEILAFGDLVQVCETPADWATAGRALATAPRSKSLADRQRGLAQANLWSAKSDAIYRILAELANLPSNGVHHS